FHYFPGKAYPTTQIDPRSRRPPRSRAEKPLLTQPRRGRGPLARTSAAPSGGGSGWGRRTRFPSVRSTVTPLPCDDRGAQARADGTLRRQLFRTRYPEEGPERSPGRSLLRGEVPGSY